MTDLKVVELPCRTEPTPADREKLGQWVGRHAKDIETGEYPHIERVYVITYSPDADEVFEMLTAGIKEGTMAQAIGHLELMLHKLKSEIRL